MAADEWRQCAEWLVQCQILPTDHKTTKRDGTAFDLAQSLRDGVIICHLLNQLQPSSVNTKDFSSRPQMSQFLCLKNIRTFLLTCSKVFGLCERDLFHPLDLFEVKDFRKVLGTLSRLSKCDIAQARFRGGFPADKHRSCYDEKDDIYGNLQELASENDLEDQDDIYENVYEDENEAVYGNLCYRPDQSPQPQVTTFQPKTKREHCLKELLDTEMNYVDALRMIVTHFIKPLSLILKASDMEIIFSCIEKLLLLHEGLKTELNTSVLIGTPKLWEVFIRYKKELLIYGTFCANLPMAQCRIEEVCLVDGVQVKIQECESKANKGRFRLQDLLHVPMQRVLKYHLLIKELIKNTDESDEEYSQLSVALEAMQDLSLFVNEVKRDHEAMQLISDIQNSINELRMPSDMSLKDYGRFQKDGELKVLSHADNRSRGRHVFLFDRVMLICKARILDKLLWGETYSFKDTITLYEYKPEGSPPVCDKDRKTEKWTYSFFLVKKDGQMAFTFYAKTDDQRQKWLEAIRLALDNTHPAASRRSHHDYVMHTFDQPKECDKCGKLLRGSFYQGYLNRETKEAVHKECIAKRRHSKRLSSRSLKHEVQQDCGPCAGSSICRVRVVRPYTGTPSPPAGMHSPLNIHVNYIVDVVDQSSDTWWKGRHGNKEGFFPSSCVVILPRLQRQNTLSVSDGNDVVANGGIDSSSDVHSPTGTSQQKFCSMVQDMQCSLLRTLGHYSDLQHFPWYVGFMERPEAQAKLEHRSEGTFLVRVTNNPVRKGELSLSIKYSNAIRHIKVNRTDQNKLYLAEGSYFENVEELVQHYEQNSLSVCFPDVETTLLLPFRSLFAEDGSLGYAVAIYSFTATSSSHVTLKLNDRISVISKCGQNKGWWKGENLRTKKTGYFPLAYVHEERSLHGISQ